MIYMYCYTSITPFLYQSVKTCVLKITWEFNSLRKECMIKKTKSHRRLLEKISFKKKKKKKKTQEIKE